MSFLGITKTLLMFVILCFSGSGLAAIQDALANLTDENLRSCVVEQIDLNLQVTEITQINCVDQNIASLSGLSNFKGLTKLELSTNRINDLTPLSSLTKLEFLSLSQNLIDDIKPVSGLTNLDVLVLRSNLISTLALYLG